MVDENNHTVPRRNVLKYSSSAIIASSFSGVVSGANYNSTKIPLYKSGGEVAETREVPKQWKQEYERAQTVKENLKTQLTITSNPESQGPKKVAAIGISSTSDKTYSGLEGPEITIAVNEDTGKGVELSAEPDTVPIRKIKEEKGEEQYTCNSFGRCQSCNREDFNYVYGGIQINGGGDGLSSSGWIVERNGEEYMLMCAHGLADECIDIGAEVYEKYFETGEKIGEVADGHGSEDWAIVEETYDADHWGFKPTIPQENCYSREFIGHYTYWGAQSVMVGNDPVYKVGYSSCFDSGKVDRIEEIERNKCGHVTVDEPVVHINSKGGDSGGPVYGRNSNGDLIFLHLHTHGANDCSSTSFSRGVTGYYLNNNYGINFDTGY